MTDREQRERWASKVLNEGVIKKQNAKRGKYIVLFRHDYYLIADGIVQNYSIYMSTLERDYKRF